MFSGATISGEGNVRLIINISALLGEETPGAKASVIPAREPLPLLLRRPPRRQ